ncbi:MAG TPA: AAA family ATPase [Candidatus Nanoarchaeia archaeon]|nr:AAA family ATPase [Candidatus Nanoarchaeia archaeon]
MKSNFLIIIDGTIGAGKSTTANLLHKKLNGTALISLDKIKHFISGVKIDDFEKIRLASEIGSIITKEYLKRRINVIVEKSFTQERYVKDFLKMINKKGINILIYQIDAPFETRKLRVKQRTALKGGTKISLSKLKRNTLHFQNLRYKKAKIFDSNKMGPMQIVNKILQDLK